MDKASIAYENLEFLNSDQGRTLRVLAEYLEPEHRFKKNNIKNTVVFFGSARILSEAETKKTDITEKNKAFLSLSRYYEDACELSSKITQWGIKKGKQNIYICSGGGPGIMEAANKGSFNAKGRSIGLNINLPFEQEPNNFITKELNFEYHYFFMRKLMFLFYAKALCIFPGGFGTLDEFMEILTLIQTEKMKSIPIVLYGSDYWNKVINFEALVEFQTIGREDLDLFKICDNVNDAFKHIKSSIKIDD